MARDAGRGTQESGETVQSTDSTDPTCLDLMYHERQSFICGASRRYEVWVCAFATVNWKLGTGTLQQRICRHGKGAEIGFTSDP
jgi:hypothetical protein